MTGHLAGGPGWPRRPYADLPTSGLERLAGIVQADVTRLIHRERRTGELTELAQAGRGPAARVLAARRDDLAKAAEAETHIDQARLVMGRAARRVGELDTRILHLGGQAQLSRIRLRMTGTFLERVQAELAQARRDRRKAADVQGRAQPEIDRLTRHARELYGARPPPAPSGATAQLPPPTGSFAPNGMPGWRRRSPPMCAQHRAGPAPSRRRAWIGKAGRRGTRPPWVSPARSHTAGPRRIWAPRADIWPRCTGRSRCARRCRPRSRPPSDPGGPRCRPLRRPLCAPGRPISPPGTGTGPRRMPAPGADAAGSDAPAERRCWWDMVCAR